MGDMGCHIIDHPVWALELGPPSVVEARTTLDGSFLDGDKPNFETYPIAAIIYYEFPARGDLPAGADDLVRRRPDAAGAGRTARRASACPTTASSTSAARARCITARTAACRSFCRAALHEEAAKVRKTIDAIARPLRRMGRRLQGRPATRVELRLRRPADRNRAARRAVAQAPGRRLEWDSENQKIKNAPELNHLVHTEYRSGWSLS